MSSIAEQRTSLPYDLLDELDDDDDSAWVYRNPNGAYTQLWSYVKFRLERDGLSWQSDYFTGDGDGGDVDTKKIAEIVIEFENQNSEELEKMVTEMDVRRWNDTDHEFRKFKQICNELCKELNWGRIVALYAFVGCLATYCAKNNLSFLTEEYVYWVATTPKFVEWIQTNGGLNKAIERFANKNRRSRCCIS